jgi:tripartite-type tricarboxylate transporter receptor subunit TctC
MAGLMSVPDMGTGHRHKEEIGMRTSHGTRGFVAVILSLAMASAWGQAFPTRAMRIVVPYAPGGTVDWLGRAVAEQLRQRFKQPVIVENRPGGGAVIGMENVARSAPDGYSLVLTSNTVAAVRIFNKDATFDAQKSLAPVSLAMRDDYFLFTSAQLPARTLKEFIAHAREQSGKLNHGAVTNSMQLLDSLRLINQLNVPITLVPYNGGAASTLALLANEIQSNLTIYSNFGAHLKAGKVKALAVTAAQRSQVLPNVPTAKESGIDFEASIWYAVFTSPGTPTPIVSRLSTEVADIIRNSPVSQKIREQGLLPIGSTPEELARTLLQELNTSQEVARRHNL